MDTKPAATNNLLMEFRTISNCLQPGQNNAVQNLHPLNQNVRHSFIFPIICNNFRPQILRFYSIIIIRGSGNNDESEKRSRMGGGEE